MAAWPGGLPQFILRDGFERKPSNQSIRSRMDTGPAKRRRRFTTKTRKINAQVPLADSTEIGIFETFFEDDLAGGTLSFTMTEPIFQVTKTFAFVSGEDAYTIRPDGGAYMLFMRLEILD